MHGQPRKPPKPEDAASIAKAANLQTLQSQLLQNHKNKIYTKEALEISSKLLEINPEVYTAWNYRKLGVEHYLRDEIDHDSIKTILNEELRVVEIALRRNPKCYGAWHHRKWVLKKGFSSIDHEFRLVDQLLKADSRNFHGWNYRRFVAALNNVSKQEELKFTTDKIEANFSNYSAWHNRSVLLSHLLKQKAEGFVPKENVLKEEYELVSQAIFTDSDDQSGWFYHLWLLDQTVSLDAPLLISSWPVHGSDLIISSNGKMASCILPPFTSFHSDQILHTGTFPLILYFSQAVEGVSSSTVTVESLFDKNEHLIWKPISTNNSGRSHSWMTYLKIPDAKCHASKAYPVEVSLGHSQGNISSSGSCDSYPFQFRFTLNLLLDTSEHTETESGIELIVWKDDNFYAYETLLQDTSSAVVSIDQLRISKDYESTASMWQVETLDNEIAMFRELLSAMNCKIAKLTLARILMAYDAMMPYGILLEQNRIHSGEVLELFSNLMKSDLLHYGYYKDAHSLALIEEVTSSRESLVKHLWHYKDSTSGHYHNICLRLNNLSLSRIGFVERLLWVLMLDLSHNELQSIEGLEAMQLLSCLNLSNNKFRSFTALEPLRHMKSLRVLDISYNEIGAHSIDTTRYLCSSPLSHTKGSEWNVEENGIDVVNMAKHWEAILIFNDLCLTQLDAIGNAFNDESFGMILVKFLPTLKWLDGTRV
eukprot:TRINITY_DN21900_c0_g1_i1.p1 TRINITY_DN21900_c0_g1~~TRINITY_DN21900_c0_g1_i1.p1  ORF type:complete len:707 (+),score=80.64 TRINITY_DN21900_c0_g1_i1:80-2200(+)